MPRKSDLKFPEEDQAFLDAQADALGCDAQTYLRMVVRQMRLGQLPTLGFGGKPTAAGWDTPRPVPILPPRATYFSEPEQWGQPAPLPEQNAPAEEFHFPRGTEVQQPPIASPQAIPSIVDDMARIASGSAQEPHSATPASPNSVSTLRRQLRATTAPPNISGPPGSATRIIGVSQQFSRGEEQGDGLGNVRRQNMKHFFKR